MIALLKDVPLRHADDEISICLPHVAETCASGWGLCQDMSNNLDVVRVMVSDYDLDEEEARVRVRCGGEGGEGRLLTVRGQCGRSRHGPAGAGRRKGGSP